MRPVSLLAVMRICLSPGPNLQLVHTPLDPSRGSGVAVYVGEDDLPLLDRFSLVAHRTGDRTRLRAAIATLHYDGQQ